MTEMSKPTLPVQLNSAGELKVRSLWGDALGRLLLNKLAVLGLIIVIIFLIAALIGPYVTPYDFLEQSLDKQLEGPSLEHWLWHGCARQRYSQPDAPWGADSRLGRADRDGHQFDLGYCPGGNRRLFAGLG